MSLSNKEDKNLSMMQLSIWFKKLYHGVNTRKGSFIIGTFIGLFTGISRSVISINQGETLIITLISGIILSIMWASPFFLGGIMKYPKSRGKIDS